MSQPAMSAADRPASLAEILWPSAASRRPALRALVLAVIGSALLTLSAKVYVPLPYVPMTMQTLVVLMVGAAYGWRLGAATVALYLLEGALGLPVFAETPMKGIGLAYMMGPTGGYLLGFVFAAAAVGFLAERGWDRSLVRLLVAMGIGHAVLFLFGFAWLAALVGPQKAWMFGVVPFLAGTVVKTALGAVLMPQIMRLADRRLR